MTPELRAAEKTVTAWLIDSKLPAGVANSIVAEVAKSGPQWQAMSELQRTLHNQSTVAKLERLWKGDYAANLQLVRGYVAELDKRHGGRVTAFLEDSGAGSNMAVLVQLHLHARRLAARHEQQ